MIEELENCNKDPEEIRSKMMSYLLVGQDYAQFNPIDTLIFNWTILEETAVFK